MAGETSVFDSLGSAGVVAVLVIDRAEDGVPVAEALIEGGVTAMELTLRTPAAMEALQRITAAVPQMLAGIGTILTPAQARDVAAAGAAFGVAPGVNPRVIEAALAAGLPFAPGICTPSDIERALEFDLRRLKFFPAEPSGGLKFLRSIAAPYAHLGVRYLPLGGLTLDNMAAYLGDPLVGGIGGSWLAPRDVIRDRQWHLIRDAARAAITARDKARAA
jgi:2-dehydro-3-deoxyphosphogluconate aldolase/(4S)-4-hydroxy-2-oxoglutarate aldolase